MVFCYEYFAVFDRIGEFYAIEKAELRQLGANPYKCKNIF